MISSKISNMSASFVRKDFFEVVGSSIAKLSYTIGSTHFGSVLCRSVVLPGSSKLGSLADRVARSISRDYASWQETVDTFEIERQDFGRGIQALREAVFGTFKTCFSTIERDIVRYIPQDNIDPQDSSDRIFDSNMITIICNIDKLTAARRMLVPRKVTEAELGKSIIGQKTLALLTEGVKQGYFKEKQVEEFLHKISKDNGGTCFGQASAVMVADKDGAAGTEKELVFRASRVDAIAMQLLEVIRCSVSRSVFGAQALLPGKIEEMKLFRKKVVTASRELIEQQGGFQFIGTKDFSKGKEDKFLKYIKKLSSDSSQKVAIRMTITFKNQGSHAVTLFVKPRNSIYDSNIGMTKHKKAEDFVGEVEKLYGSKGVYKTLGMKPETYSLEIFKRKSY